MVRVSLVVTMCGCVALMGYTIGECLFLAPLASSIWAEYADVIVIFTVLFVLNMFAATYALLRRLSLAETGRKLAHVEKQLRGTSTLLDELTERIARRK